jgi:recombinational DNA repair ATPase RecF
LDDPAAELDTERLTRLVDLVTELHCQLVVTSLDPTLRLFGRPDSMFHVEQGVVQRL